MAFADILYYLRLCVSMDKKGFFVIHLEEKGNLLLLSVEIKAHAMHAFCNTAISWFYYTYYEVQVLDFKKERNRNWTLYHLHEKFQGRTIIFGLLQQFTVVHT